MYDHCLQLEHFGLKHEAAADASAGAVARTSWERLVSRERVILVEKVSVIEFGNYLVVEMRWEVGSVAVHEAS